MNKPLKKIMTLLPAAPADRLSLHKQKVILNDKETNFDIRELVPRSTWNRWGTQSIMFLQPSGVRWIQFTRDYFDAGVMVNNWPFGGHLQQRGYRPPLSGFLSYINKNFGDQAKTEFQKVFDTFGILTNYMQTGAWQSIHKLGGAFDFNVKGLTADYTREKILSDEQTFIDQGLRCLEDKRYAPTWVHGDNRNTGLNEMFIVKP